MSQVASASPANNNNGTASAVVGRPVGRSPLRPQGEGNVPFSKMVFDGKRMRKAIQRRTVDYNHSLTRWMQVRTMSFFNLYFISGALFWKDSFFLYCRDNKREYID